ncbi:hypothetical protein ACJX0J_011138, partial [Zea mays]
RCFSSEILLSMHFETAVWEFHVPPRQAMQILHIGFATFIFHISIDLVIMFSSIIIGNKRCYGLLNFVDSGNKSVSVNYFHLHPLYFSALFFLHNTLHANHLSVFVVVW